jgi:hypothetical protein
MKQRICNTLDRVFIIILIFVTLYALYDAFGGKLGL